jgi:deltex-like protein
MKQINVATQKQRDIRLNAGSASSSGTGPSGLEGTLNYDMGQGDVDYQSVTRWKILCANQDYDPNTDCSIMCVPLGDGIAEPVVRLCCSTPQMPCVFQKNTIEQCLATNPTCPSCGKQFEIPGAQPSGSMTISLEQGVPCEGFPGTGTFHLSYSFPGGVQHKRMPKPGKGFGGTSREVYIPDTPEGREAVQLLKLGFQRGFLFIVGKSVTTGQDDVVIWAGIHQKTSRSGGATNHGWPDDSAFDRLKSECAARGITL